jgi:YidC/Oxa1 family membrane protein insertase
VGSFFHSLFVVPILNILVAFYKLYITIGLPGAFGFSIITITVAVRLLLHPFFKKQLEATQKMQEMKPHLDKLSKKHKNDAKALQAAQMKLYQEMGVNPAAGCLFAIVQIPLFIGLYQTLQIFIQANKDGKIAIETIKKINNDLYLPMLKISQVNTHFFGLDLAMSPAQTHNYWYFLVPVITGLFQYFQTKVTLPAQMPTVVEDKKEKKDGKEESSTSEEFQKAMNTQMKYFFPVMIGYFSYSLPLGLSLYWNIFSIFSIIQHMHLNRGKKEAVVSSKEITTPTKTK